MGDGKEAQVCSRPRVCICSQARQERLARATAVPNSISANCPAETVGQLAGQPARLLLASARVACGRLRPMSVSALARRPASVRSAGACFSARPCDDLSLWPRCLRERLACVQPVAGRGAYRSRSWSLLRRRKRRWASRRTLRRSATMRPECASHSKDAKRQLTVLLTTHCRLVR